MKWLDDILDGTKRPSTEMKLTEAINAAKDKGCNVYTSSISTLALNLIAEALPRLVKDLQKISEDNDLPFVIDNVVIAAAFMSAVRAIASTVSGGNAAHELLTLSIADEYSIHCGPSVAGMLARAAKDPQPGDLHNISDEVTGITIGDFSVLVDPERNRVPKDQKKTRTAGKARVPGHRRKPRTVAKTTVGKSRRPTKRGRK